MACHGRVQRDVEHTATAHENFEYLDNPLWHTNIADMVGRVYQLVARGGNS